MFPKEIKVTEHVQTGWGIIWQNIASHTGQDSFLYWAGHQATVVWSRFLAKFLWLFCRLGRTVYFLPGKFQDISTLKFLWIMLDSRLCSSSKATFRICFSLHLLREEPCWASAPKFLSCPPVMKNTPVPVGAGGLALLLEIPFCAVLITPSVHFTSYF